MMKVKRGRLQVDRSCVQSHVALHYTTVFSAACEGELREAELRIESWILLHCASLYFARASGSEAELCIVDYHGDAAGGGIVDNGGHSIRFFRFLFNFAEI